jgi:hypothetical protein
MACPWNIDYGDPDPQTGTVLCRCHESKKFADLVYGHERRGNP